MAAEFGERYRTLILRPVNKRKTEEEREKT